MGLARSGRYRSSLVVLGRAGKRRVVFRVVPQLAQPRRAGICVPAALALQRQAPPSWHECAPPAKPSAQLAGWKLAALPVVPAVRAPLHPQAIVDSSSL